MASANDLESLINSTIGGNDEESTVRHFLDTGYPPLNHAISARWDGGIPVGRITEIFGPESSGKTAIATAAMAAAQAAGGVAMFFDHERSFSLGLAPKLGLDVSPKRFVFKKPETFEESLTFAIKASSAIREKKIIPPDAPICIVFDSLASMVPQSALYDLKTGKKKDAEDRTMNDNTALARATSAHFPAFAQHCEALGIAAIILNQIRTKLGVLYGDPTTTPGGGAPKFYASVRLQLGASRISKGTGAAKEIIGSEITARAIKNKVARPFKSAKFRFVFEPDGTGRFDVERSMLDFLQETGVLAKGDKGRVIWTDGKSLHPDALAKDLRANGATKELFALLPKEYEAPDDLGEGEGAE